MAVPVDPPSLNAIMRLTLRLTRDFKMATIFAREDGPRALLMLTEKSSFPGVVPLATLIFRHIVEDMHTLQQVLDTTICAKTQGVGNIVSGVGQNSVGTKELHYVLRTLGPAACRCPELFKDSAKKLLRIQLPSQLRRTQADEHELSIPPNSAQILKIVQPIKSTISHEIHPPLRGLVTILLDALVELHVDENKDPGADASDKTKSEKEAESEDVVEAETITTVPDIAESIVQQADLVRRLTGEPVDDEDGDRMYQLMFVFGILLRMLLIQL